MFPKYIYTYEIFKLKSQVQRMKGARVQQNILFRIIFMKHYLQSRPQFYGAHSILKF